MAMLNRRMAATAVLLFMIVSAGLAQTETKTIQSVYEQFSNAYEELDSSIIKQLYAEDSYYLVPTPSEGVRTGRESIVQSFRTQFESARAQGTNLAISFRILQRDVSGNLAYDVGYYRYEATPENGEPVVVAGKFVTVLKKDEQGNWKFVVDSYSNTPLSSFETAE